MIFFTIKLNIKRFVGFIIVFFFLFFVIRLFNESNDSIRFKSNNYTSIYPHIALIVDDRTHFEVIRIVQNILEHIPTDWKIQMVLPISNWNYFNTSILSPLIKSHRIVLTPLEFPRLDFTGSEFINLLLTSADFWRQVQGEKILYFQTDSVICSNSSYKFSEFLNFDFIGAPWPNGKCCNGGFSLRSRRKMLEIYESGRARFRLHSTNEDVWLGQNLPYFNGRVAPAEIAKKFSVESVYHPRPFAVHKPNVENLGKTNIKLLCNDCPELKITAFLASHCQ